MTRSQYHTFEDLGTFESIMKRLIAKKLENVAWILCRYFYQPRYNAATGITACFVDPNTFYVDRVYKMQKMVDANKMMKNNSKKKCCWNQNVN